MQDDDIEINSPHNEAKSVVTEIFIRTLNDKIMTLIPKDVYIEKSDNILNKYNNTYHSTIKMRYVDLESSRYFDFNKESNEKFPKFKGDHQNIKYHKNNTKI